MAPNLIYPQEAHLSPAERAMVDTLEVRVNTWLGTQRIETNTRYVFTWEFQENKNVLDALVARYHRTGWGISKGIVAEINGTLYGEISLTKTNAWGIVKALLGIDATRRNRSDVVIRS